jgi:hypothetical protein
LNVTDRDEYLDQTNTASDITIYGETESLDCPLAGADGFCFMIEKYGMNSNGGTADDGMLSDRDKELLFQEISSIGHNVEVKQLENK